MSPKLLAVIRREYVERLRGRAFWISTLIIPILVALLFVVQIQTAERQTSTGRVAVLDLTGRVADSMTTAPEKGAGDSGRRRADLELEIVQTEGRDLDAVRAELDHRVSTHDLKGYVVIPKSALTDGRVEYDSISAASDLVGPQYLRRLVQRALVVTRLGDLGVLREQYDQAEIAVDLELKTIGTGANLRTQDTAWVALSFLTIMYISFFLYGAMIMNGVLEEKNNRIVEVVISSVRPTTLMLGKILGIGAVGLTQYALWTLFAANLSTLFGGWAAAAGLAIPGIPFGTLVAFVSFFGLGYLFYASLYAAIAAPFKTTQEAQHFQFVPILFLMLPMMLWFAVVNEPNGVIARVGSFFPPTAPLFMFLRVAVEPPAAWEIALSIVSILVGVYAMAWLAGRIYRTGILMYGKRPTIGEIARWVREAR